MPLIRASTSSGPRPRSSERNGGGRVDRAKQAAIEKTLCQAFLLNCGHYTYLEDQLGWACWRPRNKQHKRLYYCEKCSDWVIAKPKPKPIPMPDEPLF